MPCAIHLSPEALGGGPIGKLRDDPDANRIFVDLLTSDNNAEMSLRRMNEAGVLGRFVPEFGQVVGMKEFTEWRSCAP